MATIVRSRHHAEAQISHLLSAANARRRVRTLTVGDIVQVIREAREDGTGCTGGGTVARAYDYPATQVAAAACRRSDRGIVLWIGTQDAKREASAWISQASADQITIAPTPLLVRHAKEIVLLSRECARRIVAAEDARRHAARAPVATLPIVPVTLADSAAAGNCARESTRIAMTYFVGRAAVPSDELLRVLRASEPHLVSFGERAVRAAAAVR